MGGEQGFDLAVESGVIERIRDLDRAGRFVPLEARARLPGPGRVAVAAAQRTTAEAQEQLRSPQLEGLSKNAARFGEDPALYRDRCLADDMVGAAEREAEETLGVVPG